MINGLAFINRTEELRFLEKRYKSSKAEFLIIYGRRRIGKTALLKHFSKDKNTIYHLVSREAEQDQIKEFHQTLTKKLPELADLKDDWEILLTNLKNYPDLILIIDEFQNLISTKKEILNRIQKIWDECLKTSSIMLILTGSSIGMMETDVLSYKSPLYGRRTGQWKVQPLPFYESRKFFPTYTIADQIRSFAILGGVPFFLEQFDPKLTIQENMVENIANNGCVLREETRNLLREELREPKNYFSILKNVAHGKTTFNEIVQQTGIIKNSLNKYLLSLQHLHLLEKKLPLTADEKSKQGRYYIKDNYFNFWFRFILPNETFLEQDFKKTVHEIIWPEIDTYVSRPFEEICRQILLLDQPSYSKIGTWWYQHNEIDIVALNEQSKNILYGECKWQNKKMDKTVYEQLLEKKELVRWKNTSRKERIVLFSKNGFTTGLNKIAQSENILLYDLKKMEDILLVKMKETK